MAYSLDPPGVPGARMALLAALIDGDLGVAVDLATGLLAEGIPFEVLVTELLAPVQTELGRRWAVGDLTVADEHAATAATESLVAIIAGTVASDDGPAVVVTCAAGESHSLPARIVAATLALGGFRSLFLGASLPAADLGEYIAHQRPIALAISVSMPSALIAVARSAAAAHEYAVPVVVGGRAIGGSASRATRLGADAYGADPSEAVEVVSAWSRRSPDALAPSAILHAECAVVDRVSSALVASALDGPPSLDPALAPALAEELMRVLDVVQAALVLQEPEILTEHVSALRSAADAEGLTLSTLEPSLTALTAAMGGPLPELHELLVDAIR